MKGGKQLPSKKRGRGRRSLIISHPVHRSEDREVKKEPGARPNTVLFKKNRRPGQEEI